MRHDALRPATTGKGGAHPLHRRARGPPADTDPDQEVGRHRPSPRGCRKAIDVVLLHQQRAMIIANDFARISLLADTAVLDPDGARAETPDLGHRMRDEEQRAGLAEAVDPVEALALE